MTLARSQPCLINLGSEVGYFNGRKRPRNFQDRSEALFLYNNHFCLIWKSQAVSFIEAVEKLKPKFKMVYNYKTEANVDGYFNYEFTLKKLM